MKSDLNKLLILYDYFSPAYKAGGPIQSILNLVRSLDEYYNIYIITSNFDLGDSIPLNVESDKWLRFENTNARVIYISKRKIKSIYIFQLINQVNPSRIFVNGVF
jgi:hypothetical protein